MEPIQRNGEWWHRQPTGEWLRYDGQSGQWLEAGGPPPPPPPPDFPPNVPFGAPRRRFSLPAINARVAVAVGLTILMTLLTLGGVFLLGGTEPESSLAALPASLEPPKMSKKAQFIHDADTLCIDYVKKINRLPIPTDPEQLARYFNRIRGIVKEAIERGRAFDVPKGARKQWKKFTGTKADLEVFDRLITAARNADIATINAIQTNMNDEGVESRRWAKRYGMKVCSKRF